MNFDLQKLYDLLPALYRLRDAEMISKSPFTQAIPGTLAADEEFYGPLKAFLSVIAEQVEVLEENLEQLYDDQFIETCSEWVVPYIGALVGARGLMSIPDAPFSERAQVANTIAYRRRKGTLSLSELLARDVTGWDAHAVEFFQYLATTQYMNHVRPGNLSMASLRNWKTLYYANTPFDEMAHTADVRRIESLRGKYNIPNIGIFLWRIGSFQLVNAPAYRVDDLRFTFDALGKNAPLYNIPETEQEITQLSSPFNVPMPMGRRVLAEQLEAWYGQEDANADADKSDKSVLIFADGQPLLPDADFKNFDIISVCNLSDDPLVPGAWANMPDKKIAIDPVLGRIALPPDLLVNPPLSPPEPLPLKLTPAAWPPNELRVSYSYGFTANMGGGGYDRSDTLIREPDKTVPGTDAPNIQQAINDLIAELTLLQASQILKTEAHGVIEIADNSYYFENLVIKAGKNQTIELRAKDQHRPVLVLNGGAMRIEGEKDSKVILNGILFSGGQIQVPAANNQLQKLEIRHCTLLPAASPAFAPLFSPVANVAAEAAALPRLLVELSGLSVSIEKSITGSLRVVEGAAISISDSIVDALDKTAVAFASPLDNESAGGVL
ncbi:MAG: hypothetical protein AAB316_02200, partial [Bacteroidota bacterium]